MPSKLSQVTFFGVFWPPRAACEILVPQPGMEPRSPTVEVPSPNYWTAREVPTGDSFTKHFATAQ